MRRIRMVVLVIIIITIARRYQRVPQSSTYKALQQRWEQEDRLLDVEVWGAVPLES